MNDQEITFAARHIDMQLPNIYWATVQHFDTGETYSFYVAADYNGAAHKKVANLCAMKHHFRPYRSNSVMKMRRMKLADYLENPAVLTAAIMTANELGERDTVQKLMKRPAQVAVMLEELRLGNPKAKQAAPVDFGAAWDALCAEMQEVELKRA